VDDRDTAPGWRLVLAVAIVFGIIGGGFLFIYSWMLLFPALLAVIAVVIVRALARR
jgi:hypothetical protein